MRKSGLSAAVLAAATVVASPQGNAATLRMASAVDGAQSVGFDVYLPLHDQAGLEALLQAQQDPASASYHRWLTPAQFGERFGPDAATEARVAASFTALGLSVETHTRSLHVTGSAAQVARALHTSLMHGMLANGRTRIVASTAPSLPAAASAAGAVLLDFARDVRLAHTEVRRVPGATLAAGAPQNRESPTGGYWFTDLKQAYQYPSYQTTVTVGGKKQRLDGTGATIGILMSSDVIDSDIKMTFDHEKFSTYAGVPDPKLYARVYVEGGASVSEGETTGVIDESSLDVEESLTGAPGAHVILYDIPDLSDQSILAGYLTIDEANTADVVSSSFGGCELAYTAAYNNGVDETYVLQLYHELFEQGNAQGISFLASSGDEAGLECPTANYVLNGTPGTFFPSVSTPAADTAVTAVGGTNVVTNYKKGSLDSSYVGENAWSDPEVPYDIYGLGANVSGGSWGAGGGVSALFTKPAYQLLAKTGSSTMRTLPDIGMQVGGCPAGISITPCNGGDNPINGNGNTQRSYVWVAVQGQFVGLIGTSVSSPELAGATALLVEQYGRFGNLNNYIYALSKIQQQIGVSAATAFHRPIPGYNGVVTNASIGPAYNYTVGVGTPIVYRYVGAPSAKPAGLPQTASNP